MKFLVKHLDSVGESYWQHLFHAMGFAFKLLAAGIVCLLHAIFPFLFEKTGSKMICELYNTMVQNRDKLTPDCKKKVSKQQSAATVAEQQAELSDTQVNH